MSALTRVFVIMLVVCSLLMTAAVVVFVSRVDDYKKSWTSTLQELNSAKADRDAANAQVSSVRAGSDEREQAANTRIASIQKDLLAAQQQVADKAVEVAEKSKQLSLKDLESARLSEGLKASEATKAQLLAQVTQLRTVADENTKKNAELNAAVSDLTNKLQVTERDRNYLAEQMTEAQAQLAKQSATLKGAGLGSDEQLAAAKATSPSINGIIKEVKQINSIPYATISVGSADNVTKGMEFKVVDMRQGTFLGIMTVESVDANEAVGRLEGPRVADIKPGVEVRTQL